MKDVISILCVEDVPADVVMFNHALRKGGMSFRSKRVESRDAFIKELEHNPPDLILSDHCLPSFDGFTALAIARDRRPEVPFIFVTGSLGEEMAIQSLKSGATDYVLKNNLVKLVPAVQRALREAEDRTALREKERALHESEERFRMLVEGVKDYAIFMLGPDGRVTSWNSGAEWIYGYSAAEADGLHLSAFYTPEDRVAGRAEVDLKTAETGGRLENEAWRASKGGRQFQAHVIITALRDESGRLRGYAQVTRDITAPKKADEALRENEERYRWLVDRCPDAILVAGADNKIVFANPAAGQLFGACPGNELRGKSMDSFFRRSRWDTLVNRLRHPRAEQQFPPLVEQKVRRLDGTRRLVEFTAAATIYGGNPAVQVIAHDAGSRREATERLRASEELKTAILDAALDAIVAVGHNGEIEEWNPAAERIFGYSRTEALGKPMDELIIPASLREVYQDGFATYLLTGAVTLLGRPIELLLQRADGSPVRAELAVNRLPGEDPPRCTAIIRDLTERKHAETSLRQSEERLRLLIESIKDYAIYMLDPEGRITSWNSGAEGLHGYRAEEVTGKSFAIFFTEEDIQDDMPREILIRAKAEGRALYEGWRLRKDGSRFWAQGTVAAVRDEHGELCGFSKVEHDISGEKEAEEQLERRVAERTAELKAANEELEAFCYSVSHDLRAPLRHIAGYVEILQTENGEQLDAAARQNLQTVADAARNLGELIDALLAFSRMGRAEMRQQPVSLDALVAEARQEVRCEAVNREIDWRVSPLPAIRGDPLMLRQVIVNLLANALKYSRTRPRTVIEITGTKSATETTVRIRDNGVGFDMMYAEKLFGVFQRLHPHHEFEGIGIGLANVRRIIERHGGRVWAEAEVEGGAAFYFSIPELPEELNDDTKMDTAGRG